VVDGLGKVLVVEDDDAIRTLLVAALRREHLEVDAASDGVDALTLATSTEYAVILLDLMLPRLNGADFLDAFHRAHPAARSVVLVITAFDDAGVARMLPQSVHAIVRKPFDVPQLVTVVAEIVRTRAVRDAQRPDDSAPERFDLGVRPPELAC
jgi:DNA-binding response OmpR family regulator